MYLINERICLNFFSIDLVNNLGIDWIENEDRLQKSFSFNFRPKLLKYTESVNFFDKSFDKKTLTSVDYFSHEDVDYN